MQSIHMQDNNNEEKQFLKHFFLGENNFDKIKYLKIHSYLYQN